MTRRSIALSLAAALFVLTACLVWAAKPVTARSLLRILTLRHAANSAPSPLPGYMPSGAMLYIEAKDLSGLLADWNASPAKRRWLASDNFGVFARSTLLLRLADAQREFSAAANVPPDATFLSQAAGRESALALYDIGKLEFVYISHVPSAAAMESALWQSHAKFETRSAAGTPFFVHADADTGRVVAFAVSGDYLLLATREDLLAAALALMAGNPNPNAKLTADPWYADAVEAAGERGDLRMVLDMEKISRDPHFRSYWIQGNVKEMRRYSAAISDLYRSTDSYREERVLLDRPESSATALAASQSSAGSRVSSASPTAAAAPAAAEPIFALVAPPSAESAQAAQSLSGLVPPDAAVYRTVTDPSADETLALLRTKILAPASTVAPPASKIAPSVALLGGAVGSAADLETRIDETPAVHLVAENGLIALRRSLEAAHIQATLTLDSTRLNEASSFVEIHSAVVIAAESEWDDVTIRDALARTVAQSVTTQGLGVHWRAAGQLPASYFELDGLVALRAAVRGKFLIISEDAPTIAAILSRVEDGRSPADNGNSTAAASEVNPVITPKQSAPNAASAPLVYAAGFRHSLARPDFARLTSVLDLAPGANFSTASYVYPPAWQRNSGAANLAPDGSREPAFFSANIASLSDALASVGSESIVIRRAPGKSYQSVVYTLK
jgi:hypothetical protein